MSSSARRLAPLLPLLLLGCKIATIRPIESQEGDTNGAATFDAARHVEALWAADVPEALAGAVELSDFLPALASDADAAGARWGRREGTGPYHVVVRGRGQVTGVDTASRMGIASLEVATSEATETVRLQIGPVLRGTSIRDALPTVSFDQFVNQIQFADVANELNARVEREVVGDLDREALAGKTVRFAGMATLGEPPLTITPVRLEVGEGP